MLFALCLTVPMCSAAWKAAVGAAVEARRIEHAKWAEAQRLGQEADEATAERVSIMHERVEEIKSEMSTRSVTISSSSNSDGSSSKVLSSHQVEENSGDEKVDVKVKAQGKGAKVKVAVEE